MSTLTQSGSIGKLTLKNRILMAPMGTHTGNMDQQSLDYFETRIDGGAAMIMCNTMVTDKFEDTSSSILLTEENIGRFRELCDYAHAHGSRVCSQLMPGCGRIGGPSPAYGVPISASPCTWLYAPQVQCHELTVEEIQTILRDYRSSAEMAIGAGADAIEIHAYGGYLTDQFLTKAWNTRTDKYGGDLKGRMKFLLEMVRLSKEAGGTDFPVIVKFTPCHYMPEEYGFRGMDEGLEIAKALEEAGVDALHVDAGCYENWYYAMPGIYFQEMAPQIRSAETVKETVNIPVITHGRLSNVAKAESVLERGVCDFVAIGRGLLADPQLPNKVAEGRTDDILPCISCNDGCIAQVCEGKPVGCAVNPFCAKEKIRMIPKTSAPKKVLVVGGGPGGCAAALLAQEAGHRVELWEKTSRLGGRVVAAGSPYMKHDMLDLVTYYQTQLAKRGVPVRYCTSADAASVAVFAPDAVIWAAGGTPLLPKSIPGLDRDFVCTAEQALQNLAVVGSEIAVIGGGLVGIETALHFDRLGKHVTVVEMADHILPQPPFAMNKMQLEAMLSASSVAVSAKTKLVAVESDGVLVEGEDGRRKLSCDTVVMSLGVVPTAPAAQALHLSCPVIPIGEALQAPRNVMAAVEEAYQAVAQL